MSVILIADSGATKAEWCLLNNGKKKTVFTPGLSPYFLTTDAIADLVRQQVLPKIKNIELDAVFFYGTGCSNAENAKSVKKALSKVFPGVKISVDTELMAAAKAVCGRERGNACILGTGSNSCY